jgi:hypothetical protein
MSNDDCLNDDCPYPSCPLNGCDGRHEPPSQDQDRTLSIDLALLNEADPIEYAASEYRCAMKYLDDIGAPHAGAEGTLSLVGRIMAAIKNGETP